MCYNINLKNRHKKWPYKKYMKHENDEYENPHENLKYNLFYFKFI